MNRVEFWGFLYMARALSVLFTVVVWGSEAQQSLSKHGVGRGGSERYAKRLRCRVLAACRRASDRITRVLQTKEGRFKMNRLCVHMPGGWGTLPYLMVPETKNVYDCPQRGTQVQYIRP